MDTYRTYTLVSDEQFKLLVTGNLVLNPTVSERNFFSYDLFFKIKYIKDIS